MQELEHLISSVGFPIVACIAMYYQNYQLSSQYQKITDKVIQELTELTSAVNALHEMIERGVNSEK